MFRTIQILSDLHLECEYFQPKKRDADIVILAGDIHKGTMGFVWARKTFQKSEIIYIAGNHEYYGSDYFVLLADFYKEAKKYDIHFLEKNEVILYGIRFLGTTLWTDYTCSQGLSQEEAMYSIRYRLADHCLITFDGLLFSTENALELHLQSVAWLKQKCAKPFDGKTVVITHHGPSRLCEHKFFGHSDFSGAFYSDLPELVKKVDIWISGHSHSNLDVILEKTRLISNQKGYPDEKETADFNENLIIQI